MAPHPRHHGRPETPLGVTVFTLALVAVVANHPAVDALAAVLAAGGGTRIPGPQRAAMAVVGSWLGGMAEAILHLGPTLSSVVAVAAAFGLVATATTIRRDSSYALLLAALVVPVVLIARRTWPRGVREPSPGRW